MTSRFEKFSERARRVLSLAQEEAQRFNHNYIGTEHILLGLVRETDGVAARVLSNLNVELGKVRSAVEFIIGKGSAALRATSASRRAPRRSLSLRWTRHAASTITTSAPSTSSSA